MHKETANNPRRWRAALLTALLIATNSPIALVLSLLQTSYPNSGIITTTFNSVRAQAPGTTPVVVSHQTMMMHGRKYYIHIVEKGQTVYSISKAYKVETYDAVTHVDIHFLQPGDTVWLPARGQFSEAAQEIDAGKPKSATSAQSAPSKHVAENPSQTEKTNAPAGSEQPAAEKRTLPPSVRPIGKTLHVAVMMPLHLDQIDQISTSKFDIEQRGKKSYRQFEFIEFYEGIRLALDKLAQQGTNVELNVIDVSENSPAKVEAAFASHHVEQSDVLIALLLRESFDKAAELAKAAGVHIVNPMATRSELCLDNPYMVKMQPSVAGQVSAILKNIRAERPSGHIYVIHSGVKAEKAVFDELRRQLDEKGDMPYTLFNWSQSAKLVQTLKKTPGCTVVSVYDQGRDPNRVFAGNLLNRLAAFKQDTPVLYTIADWTREYTDIDFGQLQQVSYHCFSTAWDMSDEVHVQFLKDFRTAYGSEPTSSLAAMGYDLTLYIVGGLSRRGTDFWASPTPSNISLTQPIHLHRSGEGLENNRIRLYRMENLRLQPARNN